MVEIICGRSDSAKLERFTEPSSVSQIALISRADPSFDATGVTHSRCRVLLKMMSFADRPPIFYNLTVIDNASSSLVVQGEDVVWARSDTRQYSSQSDIQQTQIRIEHPLGQQSGVGAAGWDAAVVGVRFSYGLRA